MREVGYRFFDHTGDFGVDVEGPDAAAVVAAAGRAFLDLLTDAPATVAERERRELSVSGVDAADALVSFMNELLYLFEAEGFLCARFAPERVPEDGDEATIEGAVWGEPFDAERHPIARPVKAVTHHGAALEVDEGGWRARLVFDL